VLARQAAREALRGFEPRSPESVQGVGRHTPKPDAQAAPRLAFVFGRCHPPLPCPWRCESARWWPHAALNRRPYGVQSPSEAPATKSTRVRDEGHPDLKQGPANLQSAALTTGRRTNTTALRGPSRREGCARRREGAVRANLRARRGSNPGHKRGRLARCRHTTCPHAGSESAGDKALAQPPDASSPDLGNLVALSPAPWETKRVDSSSRIRLSQAQFTHRRAPPYKFPEIRHPSSRASVPSESQ
jgi:hypothetical protein